MSPNILNHPYTDCGNADRLVSLHGPFLKYVTSRGWMVWTGTHWQLDELGLPVEAAKETAKEMAEQANRMAATSEMQVKIRDRALKYALSMESSASISAQLRLAQSDPEIARNAEAWNRNAYLLNCLQGTIDLKTEKITPHDPKDLITHCAPSNLATGFGTRWQLFLDEIFPDKDLQRFVQRAIGCGLIGNQMQHVIFVLNGIGGNGKGAFTRGISHALGTYVTAIPAHLLVETNQIAHPTEIADLYGKRLAISAETPDNKKLDETKIKSLSGGDMQKARFLNRDFFEWKPTHTLYICCNRLPKITGTDKGIWRRIMVIPFEASFSNMAADLLLDEKLAAESDYIAQWCATGAADYLREGLGTCDAVEAATAAYREDEDVFGTMLAEICDIVPDHSVQKKEFRELLKLLYEEAGLHYYPSDKSIKKELENRGIGDGRLASSTDRVWKGLRVKELRARELRDNADAAQRQKQSSWADSKNRWGD